MNTSRTPAVFLLLTALSSANLLNNPGFEQWNDDSTPAGWTVEARSRTGISREPDTVRSGAASCRLTRRVSGTGNNAGVFQRVAVQPGQEYTLSVSGWDDNGQVILGTYITWRTMDSSFIRSKNVAASDDSSSWQMLTGSDTAPVDARFADVILRTYGVSGAQPGNRVLADDASFGTPYREPDTTCLWFFQDSLGDRLVAFFDLAQASIDYCCYNSSRPDVGLALIRAHDRGVRVRVITDNTRLDDPWVAYLRGSGITVWSDSASNNASNYMHNKFAVRDLADSDTTNDRVWNASYNPNDGELNADYALDVPSAALARAYRLEFNQMWGDTGMTPNPARARFHSAKTDVLSGHEFELNGRRARLFFSPQNRVVDTITAVASLAGREIGFAINAFTFNDLGDAMLARQGAGVRVFGTFDRANVGDSASEYWRLKQHGLPVLVDSFRFGSGTVHEKVMVVDSQVTICGSANWSNNANYSNDENTLVLYDPALAARFMAEIVARYLEAGGTYPPAIAEPGRTTAPQRPTLASPLRPGSLPAGARFYDASGRVCSKLRPGVYFQRQSGGPAQSIILIR